MNSSRDGGGASRGPTGGREATDEQMEQIRDLLLGDAKQRMSRIESRLEAIEARLAALTGEVESERRAAFDALARGVTDLGEQIRRIAKP